MSLKPRYLKSINSIKNEPKYETTTVQSILLMDIAGHRGGEIAKALDLTEARVSVIKNSPLFLERKKVMWESLKSKVLDKRVEDVTGEEVKKIARGKIVAATTKLADTAVDDPNAFARNAAYKELRDVAGLKAKVEESTSIVIDQKLSQRLNRVLDYDECRPHDGSTKITITKKVSS